MASCVVYASTQETNDHPGRVVERGLRQQSQPTLTLGRMAEANRLLGSVAVANSILGMRGDFALPLPLSESQPSPL